jgi:P-type E1-E2 ATPase
MTKVGDILYLKEGDEIPADCIILESDNLKNDTFVQTAQLDGERNLKQKTAPRLGKLNLS